MTHASCSYIETLFDSSVPKSEMIPPNKYTVSWKLTADARLSFHFQETDPGRGRPSTNLGYLTNMMN